MQSESAAFVGDIKTTAMQKKERWWSEEADSAGFWGDQKDRGEIWDCKMFLKMMSISWFNQFEEDSETEQLHHSQRIADYRSSCL